VWQIAQSHEIAFIGVPESPTAQIQKLKTKRETVQLKGKPASPASPQNINPPGLQRQQTNKQTASKNV